MGFNYNLFFFITAISACIDQFQSKCKNQSLKTIIISASHHAFSTYLWFGSFLGADPQTHFIWTMR